MGSSTTIATGRVVRLEMSYNDKGTAMTKWAMPIDFYDFATKSTDTVWYNCVMWGQAAERIGTYCKDGAQVMATGVLTTRLYPTKDRKPAISHDFKVERCEIIVFPPKSSSGGSRSKSDDVDYDMGDFEEQVTPLDETAVGQSSGVDFKKLREQKIVGVNGADFDPANPY